MSNPLNIRAGDTVEYTGESWWANLKQVVDHVSERGMHWANRSWCDWSPGEGFEYVVHYVARDGDRYYCSINDTTYTYRNGEPFFTSRMTGDDQKAEIPDWFLTSNNFKRPKPTVLFLVAVVASMAGLAYAMRTLPVGTSYAVWVGIGAVLTVAWAIAKGQEKATTARIGLLLLLVASVVGLKVVS